MKATCKFVYPPHRFSLKKDNKHKKESRCTNSSSHIIEVNGFNI